MDVRLSSIHLHHQAAIFISFPSPCIHLPHLLPFSSILLCLFLFLSFPNFSFLFSFRHFFLPSPTMPPPPNLPSPHLPFFTSPSLFLSSSSPPPFPHLLSLLSSLAFNPDASLTSDLPLWLHHFLLFCILLPTSFCNSSCMLVSPLSNSSSFQSSLVFYDVYCLFSSPFIVSCLSSSLPHCLFSPDFLSLNL